MLQSSVSSSGQVPHHGTAASNFAARGLFSDPRSLSLDIAPTSQAILFLFLLSYLTDFQFSQLLSSISVSLTPFPGSPFNFLWPGSSLSQLAQSSEQACNSPDCMLLAVVPANLQIPPAWSVESVASLCQLAYYMRI